MAGSLLVTQVRSQIGSKPKHRGTLRALGLGRIGKSNLLPDRPEIRGMVAKVPHLVTMSEVHDHQEPTLAEATREQEPTLAEATREQEPTE